MGLESLVSGGIKSDYDKRILALSDGGCSET